MADKTQNTIKKLNDKLAAANKTCDTLRSELAAVLADNRHLTRVAQEATAKIREITDTIKESGWYEFDDEGDYE